MSLPALLRRLPTASWTAESFDVFIGPPVQMNRVVQNNKIIAETRTAIAQSGIGVGVRAGAPKPDITSVEAFKQTLLHAKSIGYLKQDGTSGAYLHGLFERLGIADMIKSKIVRPETDIVSELVAKGEIELGLVVITQIMTTPGVDLVGPLPREVQSYVRWSGGVSANSAAPQRGEGIDQVPDGSSSLAGAEGARNGAWVTTSCSISLQEGHSRRPGANQCFRVKGKSCCRM